MSTPDETTTIHIRNSDDVVRLGAALGTEFAAELTIIAKALPPQARAIFFCSVLGGPAGCMGAAIGEASALEVMDQLKTLLANVAAQVRSESH